MLNGELGSSGCVCIKCYTLLKRCYDADADKANGVINNMIGLLQSNQVDICSSRIGGVVKIYFVKHQEDLENTAQM